MFRIQLVEHHLRGFSSFASPVRASCDDCIHPVTATVTKVSKGTRSARQDLNASNFRTELRNTSCVERRLRSEEHTSELQSLAYLVCRLLLEKKKKKK